MKIAFYYHIAITSKKGAISLPGYLGVFIDGMANRLDRLYLIMHEARESEINECDYVLKQKNITWVNLGFKTPAWHRHIFHRRILKRYLTQIEDCDAIIVRSPTPLAPFFHKYLHRQKMYFMIVGDYAEGASHLKFNTLRDRLIYLYLLSNDRLFTKRIEKTAIMVNSPALYRKYFPIAKSVDQIRTTTLSANDFYAREDTCNDEVVEILYTGRIDQAKGLLELIEATALLKKEGLSVRCNIVGWESDQSKPFERSLIRRSEELGISKDVVFHGRMAIGSALNEMYRMADIYIMPSYHEGFPRAIWEAMANSLPVIATAVGGIPEYLVDHENALLIPPHSAEAIVKCVQEILSNGKLRQALITKGWTLAKRNTVEIQSANIVRILKDQYEENSQTTKI